MNCYDDILVHHGIKGQRWGDRNGPPYPLGTSEHRSVIRRFFKSKSEDNKSNNESKESNTKKENSSKKTTSAKEWISKNKKYIIAGAAVVGAGALAYAGYKYLGNSSSTKSGKQVTYDAESDPFFQGKNKTIENGKKQFETLLKDKNTLELYNKSIDIRYTGELGSRYRDLIHKGQREVDFIISEGTEMQTLAKRKDRTENTDMFYAAVKDRDKLQYLKDFGTDAGVGFKYNIKNKATKDIKIAGEDSSVKMFENLVNNSPSFRKHIFKDSGGLYDTAKAIGIGLFTDEFDASYENLYKIKEGFEEIPSKITNDEARTLYKMFNVALVDDRNKSFGKAKAEFFKSAKKEGFGAVLDINDALGGGLQTVRPAIIFDMDAFTKISDDKVKYKDIINATKEYQKKYQLLLYPQ